MDWASFRNLTKKYPGGRRQLAKDVGMTYAVLNARIYRETITVKQFEKICSVLKIDPLYFLNHHSRQKSS